MKTEPKNDLKQKQLEQLDAMRQSLNEFISQVENEEVSISDGRMTREVNMGSYDEMPLNEFYIRIEYLPKKKPPDLSDEIDVCAQMANWERK